MPKSVSFRVDLLGTAFSLTVEGEPAYLQAIYERYQVSLENTRRSTGLEDPLKIAILTGLLLTDDIEKIRTRSKTDEAALEAMEADERFLNIMNISEKIDRTVPVT
jgi:cell division protein ZapA (FtsZ GTPase activity inhibitor)